MNWHIYLVDNLNFPHILWNMREYLIALTEFLATITCNIKAKYVLIFSTKCTLQILPHPSVLIMRQYRGHDLSFSGPHRCGTLYVRAIGDQSIFPRTLVSPDLQWKPVVRLFINSIRIIMVKYDVKSSKLRVCVLMTAGD